MRTTTITITRGSPRVTLIDRAGRPATGVPAQVDQIDQLEQVKLSAIYGYNAGIDFHLYLPWQPNALVKQDDVLQDEHYTDPDRPGLAYRYQVVGRPKDYEYDHQEVYCRVFVGT